MNEFEIEREIILEINALVKEIRHIKKEIKHVETSLENISDLLIRLKIDKI